MVTKAHTRKVKAIKRRETRNERAETMPNGRPRFTYHDTRKGVARTDNKTGKVVYRYP